MNEFKNQVIELLLSEHSKVCRDKVADIIGGDPDKFAIAWEIFCSEEPPLPQRMAWSLDVLFERHPSHAARYAATIVDRIPFMKHPAELRMATKVLARTPIRPDLIIQLLDPMLGFLMDPQVPIAIRAYAMTLLYEISQIEKELKFELRLVIEEQMDEGSAGIRSRGKKILKKLNAEIKHFEMTDEWAATK